MGINPWKLLGVEKLHTYLCSRFDVYRRWHWHSYHRKVHWTVLGVNVGFFIIVLALSLLPLNSRSTFAEAPALTVSPAGYTNIDEFTFTLTGDPIAGAVKYQYRTGGDTPGFWADFNPALSNTVTIGPGNSNHPTGAYIEGENAFYFRALDISDSIITGSELNKQYYYNITPPGPPDNPQAIPETNSVNSFSFTWDPPISYFGDVSQITYYFSVNAYPTPTNVTEATGLSLSAGPYATLVGENNIFFVAKDEAGNIEYQSRSEATFYANTSAPPIPTAMQVDDISSKDASQYRLAVSWVAPSFPDPGNFKGYDVYSATSESGPFTKIATTTETSYVQTGLAKDEHRYYYVVATDKTGNSSAQSTKVDEFATGRYTRPPNVTKSPEVTAKSKTAAINWVTEREANSYVEFGKTNGLGQSVGNSSNVFVTDHTVSLTNLEPDTTYYYKAVFTDPDGNTGQTAVETFTTAPASVISNLKIENISTSSMTVSWDTNMPARGEVLYGKTSSFGSSATEGIDYTRKHSVKLENLDEGTEHFIKVKETDEEGTSFTSDEYRQGTLPMPRVSDFKVQQAKNANSPTVIVEYRTNVETTTMVRYTLEGGKTKEYVSIDYAKDHRAELSGLMPLKVYTVDATGRDRFGNEATGESNKITTLSDSMPPEILKVFAKGKVLGEGTNAEAQLVVKLATNEPSMVSVEAAKGINSSEYNIGASDNELAPEHTIVAKLGAPGSPYSYRIKMRDAMGNEIITDTKTIVISEAKKSAFDYVLSVFTKSFSWLGQFIE